MKFILEMGGRARRKCGTERGREGRREERSMMGRKVLTGLKTRTPDVGNNSIKQTIVLLRILASVSFLWIYTSECLIYLRSYKAVENKSL